MLQNKIVYVYVCTQFLSSFTPTFGIHAVLV